MSPTGRRTRKPEPQPTKLRDVEAGTHPLVDVDYSRVERRVIALSLQAGKTEALKALQDYCLADVSASMGVPADMLGEDKGPLTGDELQAIIEGAPPWAQDLEVQPTGWQQPSSIKRFTK